jgi:hypothetical protein
MKGVLKMLKLRVHKTFKGKRLYKEVCSGKRKSAGKLHWKYVKSN